MTVTDRAEVFHVSTVISAHTCNGLDTRISRIDDRQRDAICYTFISGSYSPGAQFGYYEMRVMLRMSGFEPGDVLRHRCGKLYRIYEYLSTRDGGGKAVRQRLVEIEEDK